MPTTSSAAMALAHACPLHPTAILDSLSKLHRRRLSFLRHAHPIAQRSIGNLHTTPARRKSSRSCCSNSRFYGSISPDSGWIDKWSQNRTRESSMRLQAVVDYRGSGVSDDEDEVGTSRSTGASTMARIVEKLKKFGYVDDAPAEKPRLLPEKGSVEDIFYAEDGVLPNARGGLLSELGEDEVVRFPWEKPPDSDEDEDGGGATPRKKRSKTSLAELTLPETELRRLRHLAIRTKSRTKIGGAGVTKEIVDKIHEKWQTEEVVRLKCEGPPALNMKRMHEILERKTGGLVIWRSGSSISLYRGVTYVNSEMERHRRNTERSKAGSSNNTHNDKLLQISTAGLETCKGNASHEMTPRAIEPLKEVNYESEVDKLLDGLGPRYTDWSGFDPLPVDADLLPGVVPGYKPPFRVLPYGVRPHLGVKDQTALRRLARVLPPHFALGRSRQHQGLAAAIVKLWEKSLIAKVALKRGVQLTSSERMAEEIKRLTGGSLLCRNKEYIVFYRGKDFLAPEVANALLERERLAKTLEEEEEQAKQRASSSISLNLGTFEDAGTTGTLKETLEANARWGKQLSENAKDELVKAAELERHGVLVRKLERQLSMAERKMMKAEKGLAQVEEFLKPSETGSVHESITDEERYMFRKLGLKMKAYLLLGRRGVFDGTVENMHLHWKYRELVKIIVKAKTFAQVKNVALALEAESGGILVSVDKISKGFAIIVFRGKDYRRPTSLRPKNLLTKRKALARSIELQRREALQHHISNLQTKVERLRKELDQMETVKKHGNEELYAKLDVAYPSEDDETEEDDDTYPEIAKNVLNSDKAWSYYTHNEEAGDYEDDAGDYDVDDDDGVTAAYDGSSDDDGGGIDNSDVKSHVNSDMSESSMFELESERTANYLHQYRDL